jgi:hypothetical protein
MLRAAVGGGREHRMTHQDHPNAVVLIVALSASLTSCEKQDSSDAAHLSFVNPEDAVAALVAAVEANDLQLLQSMLGPGTQALLSSGDDAADRNARESFVRRYHAQHRFVTGGPDDLVLQVGEDQWPLPIPLVRQDGRWQFDGIAGVEELVSRRIGANELRTIDVMRGFVAAQEEYAAVARDGGAAGTYASRFRSEPGRHNGLYWEVASDEPPSPAGPLLAAAAAEGYADSNGMRAPYRGYVYRMLFAQGPSAPGGAREYVTSGRLTGGYALLAKPAVYGVSGVMTFIVNQDGIVWQRDLGEETARLAEAMKSFDPDETWTPIAPAIAPEE